MRASFAKPYSSPEQIVQILKQRGMLMDDERKVENYLMNIGYHRLSAYIYPFYKSPKSDLQLKKKGRHSSKSWCSTALTRSYAFFSLMRLKK